MPSIPDIDINPPKYGPPNMAAELYKMIRGIPQAYEEGRENQFKQTQRERTLELQKPILGADGQPETDPMKIAAELSRRNPQEALQYPSTAITLKGMQDWLKNRGNEAPDFPEEGDSRTPSQRLQSGTGGDASYSVSDLVQRSGANISDPRQTANSLAKIFQVDPNQPLPPETAAGVKRFLGRMASLTPPGGDEGAGQGAPAGLPLGAPPDQPAEAAPGSVPGAPGAPYDPRTGPPPNMMPGVQMPGAAPGQYAQAPSLANGLRPYMQPAPAGPALPPGAPAIPSQDAINAMRNAANKIRDNAAFAPPQAQAVAKARAEQLEKAAAEAQKTRDEAAGKIDPAVVAENTRKEIEKGNIAAGQKEANQLRVRAATADQSNQKLAVMRTAMADPNFYTGPAHEAVQKYRQWLSVLPGGNPNAAKPMETFYKTQMDLLNERIQSAVQSGYTRIQIAEIKNMQKQIASMDITPAANRYIMEEMSRIHQMDIKINRFADQYERTHGYLDRGWPAAKEEFLSRPENRLFTPQEIAHPEAIAPSYYPTAYVGDVAKTKAFIREQGLKPGDPVAVDDMSKPIGPDGLRPRKLVHASDILEKFGK